MKKIFFAFVLLTLSTIAYENFAVEPQQGTFFGINSEVSPLFKNLIARLFIGGVAVWATGEIAVDMGHRYLACKDVAQKYAKELRQDGANLLSEKEIKFWSFIQGLSSIPLMWWREITATALLVGFVHFAQNTLITK